MARQAVAADQTLTQFRKVEQAAKVTAAVPKAQGDAPFLQSAAEVLGAVDRVEKRQVALLEHRLAGVGFLGDEIQARQRCLEMGTHEALEVQVRCGDRAAVLLDAHVVPQCKHLFKVRID